MTNKTAYNVQSGVVTTNNYQAEHKIWQEALSELKYIEDIQHVVGVLSSPEVHHHCRKTTACEL